MENEEDNSKDVLALFVVLPIAILVAILFFGCDLFRQTLGLPGMGETGDFINGIISPLVSIITSILLYISFRQQLRANQIQVIALRNEMEKGRASDVIEKYRRIVREIRNDLESITYQNPLHPTYAYKGSQAMEVLSKDFKNSGRQIFENNENALLTIWAVMIIVRNALEDIETTAFNKELRRDIYQEIRYLYIFKVAFTVNSLIEQNDKFTDKVEKIGKIKEYREIIFDKTKNQEYPFQNMSQ